MKKTMLLTIATLGAILAGCAVDTEKASNKLEFVSKAPTDFKVGDTSGLWVVSRTIIEANGRSFTDNPYGTFYLVSSDTNVASVIRAKQLVAKKAGETTITARDEKSTLKTETAVAVTVLPAP
ncbi:MAG: hypothetical protein M3Y08_20220 [Fibrobacterota bacterium]|nr:hypothetical protein [Fibrobacterota bacterium]